MGSGDQEEGDAMWAARRAPVGQRRRPAAFFLFRLRAALTPATGHCFSVLVIINSTAMTIGVQESFESSGKHSLSLTNL